MQMILLESSSWKVSIDMLKLKHKIMKKIPLENMIQNLAKYEGVLENCTNYTKLAQKLSKLPFRKDKKWEQEFKELKEQQKGMKWFLQVALIWAKLIFAKVILKWILLINLLKNDALKSYCSCDTLSFIP